MRAAGFEVVITPANVDESRRPDETPGEYVKRLAGEKAEAVWRGFTDLPVLGADTVVVQEGEVLEKPKDAEDARRMLYALSGRYHEVMTGFAVITPEKKWVEVVETRVGFRTLTPDEIEAYVRSGEPMDKAGGYGIQAGAAHFVTRIEGSYTNVVGLPMAEVVETIRTSNIQR
jgi:septum formation protein